MPVFSLHCKQSSLILPVEQKQIPMHMDNQLLKLNISVDMNSCKPASITYHKVIEAVVI